MYLGLKEKTLRNERMLRRGLCLEGQEEKEGASSAELEAMSSEEVQACDLGMIQFSPRVSVRVRELIMRLQ